MHAPRVLFIGLLLLFFALELRSLPAPSLRAQHERGRKALKRNAYRLQRKC